MKFLQRYVFNFRCNTYTYTATQTWFRIGLFFTSEVCIIIQDKHNQSFNYISTKTNAKTWYINLYTGFHRLLMHSTRVIGENKEVFYINCRSQVHCGRSISLFKIKTKHCSLSKNRASTGYFHYKKIGQNDISFFFNINFKIIIRCSTLTCNISKLQFYSLYTT